MRYNCEQSLKDAGQFTFAIFPRQQSDLIRDRGIFMNPMLNVRL